MARSDARAGGPSSDGAGTQSRYRDNLARHLIGISRDLQARVRHALHEEGGFEGLRPSFGPFLSLIWDEGRPLHGIAEELAISSQAASQLANLVERAGYLERRPNPADRRSRVVTLTPRGRRLVAEGVRIILETESAYAALVGSDDHRAFTRALAALYRGLGLPMHTDPALTAPASRSVGVLPLIAERIQGDLMQATTIRGHEGLKMSHGQVLPLIGPDGGRVGEIARTQRVSRQAISTTTRDLEELGYLRREPDPRDRRGVVLRLTGRGERLIEDSVAAVDELEARFGGIVGEAGLADLKRVARDLYHALRLEAEVFGASHEPHAAGDRARDRSVPTRPEPSAGRDIEQLATRLRAWLGSGDAARLAAELGPRAGLEPEAEGEWT